MTSHLENYFIDMIFLSRVCRVCRDINFIQNYKHKKTKKRKVLYCFFLPPLHTLHTLPHPPQTSSRDYIVENAGYANFKSDINDVQE
jgi:hypothetical protein